MSLGTGTNTNPRAVHALQEHYTPFRSVLCANPETLNPRPTAREGARARSGRNGRTMDDGTADDGRWTGASVEACWCSAAEPVQEVAKQVEASRRATSRSVWLHLVVVRGRVTLRLLCFSITGPPCQ